MSYAAFDRQLVMKVCENFFKSDCNMIKFNASGVERVEDLSSLAHRAQGDVFVSADMMWLFRNFEEAVA